MKTYWYKILAFTILVFFALNCSNNHPVNQSQKSKISSTIGNKITSGSSNASESDTETKTINSLISLSSTKFNSKMYDFSKPSNVTALSEREGIIGKLTMENHVILQREDVKIALINLFNNEVKYSREYFNDTHKGLGEGYGEYEAELEELIYKYMDKKSLYTMVVLLNDHGEFLTTYWKESTQLVLQRITDTPNNGNILYQIAALGKAQKEKRFTLDPDTIKSFQAFALTKLKSTEFYIREPAVEALQYITTKKDKDIIKELKTVAKSDPYRYGAPLYNVREKKSELYPVREAAQRALEYIERQ